MAERNNTQLKKRNHKMSLVLIIAGVLLMLYPLCTYGYAWYEQYKLQTTLESSVGTGDENQLEAGNNQPGISDASGGEESPVPEGAPPDETAVGGNFDEALLEIPSINLKVAVLSGTTQAVLAKAPGWYEESALPGQGNTAIAGHRTMHGAFFRHLNSLKAGDKIILTYDGKDYEYKVEKVFPVAKNDWSVIKPCGYPALTLTTCHPVGSSRQRLVVRAALVSDIK